MSLAHQAYVELYKKEPDYDLVVSYHGKLRGYNATVRKSIATIEFRLSRKLETCEPEIQIGIMQYLLNRLFKTKIKSDNIDLYHSFLKKMSELAPVTKTDPILEESFKRMNALYFHDMMSQPNLVWGSRNFHLLGTYTYENDTITISKILEEDDALLDYVVYHEMLHKKHKFNHTGSRTHSHTKAFREDERKYHDKRAEEKLHKYLRKMKYKNIDDEGKKTIREHGRKKSFVQQLLDWW